MRVPSRRIFGNVMYQLGSVRNHADGALSLPSDSNNPDADWGPSAQDVRHRLFVMANFPLPYSLRAGLNMQLSSARPYNITTGLDDNGDTVFNDRPLGVEPQRRPRRQPDDRRPAAHQVVQPGRPAGGRHPRACRWAAPPPAAGRPVAPPTPCSPAAVPVVVAATARAW